MFSFEWLCLGYCVLVAATAPLTGAVAGRVILVACACAGVGAMVLGGALAPEPMRVWLPHVYLAAGYWLPALLVSRSPGRFEAWLGTIDVRWPAPAFPPWLQRVGELAYLCCYPLIPLSLAIVVAFGSQVDVERFWLGRPVVTMARSSYGDRVVVSVTDFDPVGEPHLGNHFVQDQLLTIDVGSWRLRDALPTQRRTSRQSAPGDVDRGCAPMAIDLGADGSLLVAFAGTDDVWRIDARDPPPRIYGLEEHPLATPHGVAALAGGEQEAEESRTGDQQRRGRADG